MRGNEENLSLTVGENIEGLKRSCRCAEISEADLGSTLTLMGWCHRQRDLGGMIFINLRDRSGEIQLLIGDEASEELKSKAQRVRSEYVLAVRGELREREAINPDLKTGRYEVLVQELRILSEAKTPPFYIEDNVSVKDSLKLKHRYLDLRRPEMQAVFKLRHELSNLTHEFFHKEGFYEIETPMLGKSTPEGARDYLVPSRVKPGNFFALPQSPQLYKQLLMLAGYDRYMQIARCFRDEDLRADRQPEFTQIDLEMAFVDEEDVIALIEKYLVAVFEKFCDEKLTLPLPRLSYKEAMQRFGSDKPDLRFGMELQDVTDFMKTKDIPLFNANLEAGAKVIALVVPEASDLTRKELEALAVFAKTYKLNALPWMAASTELRGSLKKFFSAEDIATMRDILKANEQDIILLGCAEEEVVQVAMGQLRCEVAKKRGLIDEKANSLLWVTDFPLFEYDEEEARYVAKHHPFTSPKNEDLNLLNSDPAAVRAKAYDVIFNGNELGGGSIRIHDQKLQAKMFELLGFTAEAAQENFGFLLDAFQYGVPPHGGLAIGLDRMVMLLAKRDSIRDVIAFPKVQTSADLMTEAPSLVSAKQLAELQIETTLTETENEELSSSSDELV